MNRNCEFATIVALCTSTVLLSALCAAPRAYSQNASPAAGVDIDSLFNPPPRWKDKFGDYRSPLLMDDRTPVTTAQQWQTRRQQILDDWHGLMGKWPPLLSDQHMQRFDRQDRDGFDMWRVTFKWTPTETTAGYLLKPAGEGPFPAVVVVFYEPETGVGLGKPDRDYAMQLVRRGFVTLSIGTTDATAAKTYSLYYPTIDDASVQPLSMLAYAAANAWHVLAKLPEVDEQRIGIVGHSFGGKWAMFASCLFDRFACAAWSDPGIVFDNTRSSINYWEPWYLGYHRPPWRKRGLITDDNPARGLYPRLIQSGRDLHELHALMAPRPFMVSGGSEDPSSRWQVLNHAIQVNRVLGYEDRVAMSNRSTHAPDRQSNAIICAFFERCLKASPANQ